MRVYLIVVIFLYGTFAKSQDTEVTLYGTAVEYSNYNLIVEQTQNYITNEKTELQRFAINKKGDFKVSFDIKETSKINIKLGALQGFLFVQPGNSYNILLPPLIPLKTEDQLNPFFIPDEVNIGILNTDPDNLNEKIQSFDIYFNQQVNLNIRSIIIANNKKKIEEIISQTDSLFPSISGTWFNNYKEYAYLSLIALKNKDNLRNISTGYFSNNDILYSIPTYWSSFNQCYKNFLYKYFKSDEGSQLKTIFSEKANFAALVNTLTHDSLFNNIELSELILLKSIYDGYYSKTFDNNYLTSLAEEATSISSNQYNRQVAEDIYKKITKLTVNSVAPEIELPDLKNKTRKLKNYKGKFVYLNFASTDNYACKKDFQVLEAMSKAYKRDLHIITILTDSDIENAKAYVKKNKLEWTFLHFNQNGKVLYDYNVRAYPTYYLLDPEGNIVIAPAPAPEEDFKAIFSKTFNNYRHQQLRKNKQKERTIYDL
ncbi:TlpA family protein disulfide reductase [Saccharicrinis aurantiacus]|uniref:TlpA family protein disulfide reductase n=1 Tax=Saccharicrinis aurantiacus TaxID=1849719 RepID=UPI0024913D31|nr:TlpA disulfide reductase family protein [Saccharicrinis aurantiacus]